MVRQLHVSPILMALGLSLVFAAGCSGSDGADGTNGKTGADGADGQQGSTGPEGPAGQDGTATPSISAVMPNMAFLDREKVVTVSGSGTNWDDTATVSFGDNITVDSLTVASPTALVAQITIGADAVLGSRDVTVTMGTDVLTYSTAFMVESPLNFNVQGTSAQGSLLLGTATGRDFETPFDTTYTGDGFFTPIEYTNIQVSALTGINASLNGVAPYALDMLLFVDVDAPAGAKDIDVLSGPAGNQVHFPTPAAFTVAERAATAITAGTAATGTVSEAYGSELFSIAGPAAGAQLITIDATSTNGDAVPAFVVLPKSGSFADMIEYTASTRIIAAPTDSYYLVYWDNTGVTGYNFQIDATAIDIALGADTEPNNTIANAVAADSMPFVLKDANISTLTDEDWIKYDATSGDVGKAFHIVTMPGDAYTDTVVAAYGSDGTTLLGTESTNGDYHEDHLSAQIPAAGTYYIRISADQTGYYQPTYTKYDALITLE